MLDRKSAMLTSDKVPLDRTLLSASSFNVMASVHCPRSVHPQPLVSFCTPKCSQDSLLPAQCEVRECLQPYSPTTASNGAILPTVGDCLELRNQLTTDAYPLTLPLNSRQATLVLRQLRSFISLSYLLLMGKKLNLSGIQTCCCLASSNHVPVEK